MSEHPVDSVTRQMLAEWFERRGDAAMEECSSADSGVTWYEIAETIREFDSSWLGDTFRPGGVS